MRALAQELNRACLAGDSLRQFQRAGVEPGAAVDGGASGQGAGVGQRGADEGLGGDTVGGRAHGAGCRYAERGGHAGQHRLGGRAGEDRRAGSEVQAKELVGDAVGIGGDQVKDLCAAETGGGGYAADDAGGGVERQARGQHAIGDDGQVIDRVAALVAGTVGGSQGELPIGTVGGVDLAGQVHVEEPGAIVADGEDVSAVELDFYRLGPVAQGDGCRADECAVPAHLDLCGYFCVHTCPKIGLYQADHEAVAADHAGPAACIGAEHAVVEAGSDCCAVTGGGDIGSGVVERCGEGARATGAQLGQNDRAGSAGGGRVEHARPAVDSGGTPQGPIGGQRGEIGGEKGFLGDRVAGRTGGGRGERPAHTRRELRRRGAREDGRRQDQAGLIPRLRKAAGARLDRPRGVFEHQIAAQRGRPGAVHAGRHIGHRQRRDHVDKPAPFGRAGHRTAVQQNIGPGCQMPAPASDFIRSGLQRIASERLPRQQQTARFAVAQHADDRRSRVGRQSRGHLANHILGRVQNDDARAGQLLSRHQGGDLRADHHHVERAIGGRQAAAPGPLGAGLGQRREGDAAVRRQRPGVREPEPRPHRRHAGADEMLGAVGDLRHAPREPRHALGERGPLGHQRKARLIGPEPSEPRPEPGAVGHEHKALLTGPKPEEG